jgi:hypothetical protein
LEVSSAVIKKIRSGTRSDPEFDRRGGGVSYIDARKKRFQNAVPACVLVRKNFRTAYRRKKYAWK